MEARSRAKQILSDLGFDFRAFSIGRFLTWVGDSKKRQIITIPWAMSAGMFGAWVSDDDEPREYIFYREDVPELHQIHIQLHELAHFLWGHPTYRIKRSEIAALFAPGSGSGLFELIQLRSIFSDEMEREAETLASLIQEQVIRNAQIDNLTRGISSDIQLAEHLRDLGLI